MPDTFHLQIATPERVFADEQVGRAELPGKNGYMGILPGHAPLLSALGAGVLTYGTERGEQMLVVDGGFVEVFEDQVRVLADHAEHASEVSTETARRELDEANVALREAHDAGESDAALRRMQKAQARLDVVNASGSSAAAH